MSVDYGEPYINQILCDRVLAAKEQERLHEDSFKVWEKDDLSINEKRYWSELCRSLQNFTIEEFAVAVYVAIQNYPEMVFQLMMEEYLVNKERKNKKNENDQSI